jgi:hypothetical protein
MTEPLKTVDGGKPAGSKRLDALITNDTVKAGTTFLYKGPLNGELREGTLLEESKDGHVRLDDSGAWLWPQEIFVEEVLAVRPPAPDRLALVLEDLATIIGLLQKLAAASSPSPQPPPAPPSAAFSVPISSGKPAVGQPSTPKNKQK